MQQFLALKASAGSGKTFALSLRYIYLLCAGAKPWEILTLTFTKKAANEMKKRITKNLRDLLSACKNGRLQDDDIFKELQKEGVSAEFLTQNLGAIYEEFLQANVRITTIDAFFYSILQKFCWYAGVGNDFAIGSYSNSEIDALFLESLSQSQRQDILSLLLEQDLRLSTFLYLLSQSNDIPKREASGDFSAIAKEIEEIFEFLRTEILKFPWSSNNKNLLRTLNKQGLKASQVMAENWVYQFESHSYFKKYQSDLTHLIPLDRRLQELLLQYALLKEARIFSYLAKYVGAYKRAKNRFLRTNNTLCFDDVSEKTFELLRQNIDWEFFYFRLDDKITHILLDEFQDTSILQYEILRPLIEEILSGNGRINERSVFMVGDKKQSIYGFRGGFSGVFDSASKNLKVENLHFNYRSSARVVEFVNSVFAPLYEDYIPQKLPSTTNASGGYVSVREVAYDDAYERIYECLCELLDSGISQDDIAILVAKNDEAQNLSDTIKAHNPQIAVLTESSSEFFARFPCNALLEILRFTQSKNELNLLNAKKLLGLNINDALELPEFEPRSHFGRYVFEIIESLKLGGVMSAKFLECACEFESLEEFLENYQSYTIPTPKQSLKGVKIMTIHKSKGLEFEHLIVCDRIGRKSGDKGKFLYEYEDITLKNIYYKQAGRENLNVPYARARQKAKDLESTEELNRLYVALTRAKQSLIVLKKLKEKGSSATSRFDILNLTPLESGALATNAVQKTQEIQPSLQCVRLPKLGVQSEFVQDKSVQEAIMQDFSLQAITYGKALHSCFEYFLSARWRVDLQSAKGVAKSTESKKSKNAEYEREGDTLNDSIDHIIKNLYGFILPQSSLDSVFARFLQAKEEGEFARLLSLGNAYAEVSFIANGRFWRIDTLIMGEDSQYVLDYKSAHLPKEEHYAQVRGYMEFLSALFGRKSVGYLIYPSHTPMCVEVQA
ncbi:RecB-like helicase [Helicobacter sp. MIT 99-10781]|uniref:RecB-like helicase n=1 Tax=unclassified Helicobacter TaxID=2593540 RepID=UPI000E1FC96A|nr:MULTISPECIES: RecB-like helicase [unclassified Helicobacter]RDU56989.1 RecB-like helicase [Helicobacter sp. MIT 99-10781]